MSVGPVADVDIINMLLLIAVNSRVTWLLTQQYSSEPPLSMHGLSTE